MAEEFDLKQMEQETEEMLKLVFLSPEKAVFSETPGGFLSLKTGDKEYDRVKVLRMFPFTDPAHFISIREPDEKQKEIGVIEDLSVFPEETVKMIERQLSLRYFTPVITKINNIRDEYGYAYFDVETDRGQCRFVIHMGGSDVVHLSETRIIISDLDENRFEIPDIMKLSTHERKKLDLFL
jgi:hypothetical protein